MKKALITGVSGFAGSFLAELLLREHSYQLHGTYLSGRGLKQIAHLNNNIFLHKADLIDAISVAGLIEEVRPDVVFHLAALASPSQSFKDPCHTFQTNVISQINLLEAVRNAKLSPKVLIISSAEVYGLVDPSDLPIDEETQFKPVSPYAVSKITQDYLGLQYFLTHKIPVIRVRPFNHIGPRQLPHYAIASFAKQIAEIEKGKIEPVLKVGNLSAKRDFTDVRDIVAAYTLAIEKGVAGDVLNVGSGASHEIKKVLDMLLSLSRTKITVEIDSSRLMPVDIPDNRCDNSKIQEVTGWKPEITLERSLRDTLEYWRSIV